MSGAKQYYVEIDLDKKYQLDAYTLTSTDAYPDRDPRKWTLSGYNDETGWTELDRRTEFTFPCRYATMRFNVASQMGYSKLLLDVEDNNGSSDSQLLKWQLFGKEFISSDVKTPFLVNCTIWPEHGKINISSANELPVSYKIFNLSGILVVKGSLSGSPKSIALTQGVYVITLSDARGNYNSKIIVH